MNESSTSKLRARAARSLFGGQNQAKYSVEKFFRDPIHNLIRIESKIALDLLTTFPVQRLRRLKQLGLTSYVYPGAEHSRFAHSLGVYHLSLRLLDQLELSGRHITDRYDRLVISISGLLHDVGHGAFSHLFESLLEKIGYQTDAERRHEYWTKRIILEHGDINSVLGRHNQLITSDILEILSKNYYRQKLHKVIASQFDADRLDYMLRDSHMSGVQYGSYDLEWILRCLRLETVPVDGDSERIIVDISRGISSLENYLIGNLYLYKHVYFHKTVLILNAMMINLMVRCVDMLNGDATFPSPCPAFNKIARNEILTVEDYCSIDDTVILSWINCHGLISMDAFVSDLSERLLRRKLFKATVLTSFTHQKREHIVESVKQCLDNQNLDHRYYFHEVTPQREAYSIAKPTEIWVKRRNDPEPIPFSELAKETRDYPISSAIIALSNYDEHIMIYPPEITDDVHKIIEEA